MTETEQKKEYLREYEKAVRQMKRSEEKITEVFDLFKIFWRKKQYIKEERIERRRQIMSEDRFGLLFLCILKSTACRL